MPPLQPLLDAVRERSAVRGILHMRSIRETVEKVLAGAGKTR